MPRRTLLLILGVALVSLVCYRRAEKNPYGRHFAEVLDQIDRDYVEAVDNQKLFEGAIDGMAAIIAPVEPLPLVPAIWMIGKPCSGFPSPASNSCIRSSRKSRWP